MRNLKIHMFEKAKQVQSYVAGDNPDEWDICVVYQGKDADKLTVKDRMEIVGFARDVLQKRLNSEGKIIIPPAGSFLPIFKKG